VPCTNCDQGSTSKPFGSVPQYTMNIMLQNHTFYPILGGIENYLYHVSKVFLKMGHKPMILCEKHDHALPDFEKYHGIELIRHPYYNIPKRMLLMKPKIVSDHIKRFVLKHVQNVDLIISRYPHYCFATCSLDLDIPTMYIPATVHWRYLSKSSENSGLKPKFFNFVWKPILDHIESKCIIMSDKVITLSRHISSCLAQYYAFAPETFVVNPPGVDLDRFGEYDDSMEIRREFNIPPNRIIVLYVGRLSVEKNVGKLIKDFKIFGKNDVQLLIVGYGPERLRLEQLTNDLNMIEKITFVGPRKDVERFYKAADIFVLPSKYEGFGQVILEAMAAGLPCIAYKRVLPEYEVASEEIIEDGITGFCVDPSNEDEFQEKLRYLIDHPDIRQEMGKIGRKVCATKFTWEAHVRGLLNLMNSCHSQS